MWRFPAPALGPAPGSGPNVFRAIDLPKYGELRLPIGVAGLTLFNALRMDAVSVRLYRLAVAAPPNTLAIPRWFAFPPRRIDSPPRMSSLPVLPPPFPDSPKAQLRLTRTVSERIPGPSR